jgi:hypothetical protein
VATARPWFYVSLACAKPIGFIAVVFVSAAGPHSEDMKIKLESLRDKDPNIATCEALIRNTAYTVPPPCGELVLLRDAARIDHEVGRWNLANGFPIDGNRDYDVEQHVTSFATGIDVEGN